MIKSKTCKMSDRLFVGMVSFLTVVKISDSGDSRRRRFGFVRSSYPSEYR